MRQHATTDNILTIYQCNDDTWTRLNIMSYDYALSALRLA